MYRRLKKTIATFALYVFFMGPALSDSENYQEDRQPLLFSIEQLTVKVIDLSTNDCMRDTDATGALAEKIARKTGFKTVSETAMPDVIRGGIHGTLVLSFNGFSVALSPDTEELFCVLNISVRLLAPGKARVSYSDGRAVIAKERFAKTSLFLAGEEFLLTGPKPLDESAGDVVESLVTYLLNEIHAARRTMLDRYPNDFIGFRNAAQP